MHDACEFYDSLVSLNKSNLDIILKNNGITRLRQVSKRDTTPTALGDNTGVEVGQTFTQFGSV